MQDPSFRAARAHRWLLPAQGLVLVATAILAVASYLTLASLIAVETSSAAQINVAGRQRMLSQRIALLALQVAEVNPGEQGRETLLGDLSEAVARMEREHEGLLAGNPALGLPGEPSPALRDLYFGVESHLDGDVRRYLGAAHSFGADAPAVQSRSHPKLAEMLSMLEGDLLAKIDLAVSKYQAESERGIADLKQRARQMMLLTLLLLAAGGGLLLPLARRAERASRAVALAEERVRGAFDNSHLGVVTFAADGRVLEINPAAARTFRRAAAEALGRPIGELIVPRGRSGDPGQAIADFLSRGQTREIAELDLVRADGSEFPAELTLVAHGGPGPPVASAYVSDLSDRRAAERERRLAIKVMASVGEAMMVTDAEGHILEVNPAFSAITGYARTEVVGKNPSMLKSGRHDSAFYREFWARLAASGSWEGIIWNRKKNGDVYPEWLSVSTLRDERGDVEGRIGLFSDASERLQEEEVLRHQAQTDGLTQLPNRSQFLQRLSAELAKAHSAATEVALYFVDLDNFKGINDTLGHAAGDALLLLVADRLRTTIAPTDFVARIGGDEFTIIQPVESVDAAEETGRRITHALSGSVVIGGREVELGSSIGIALYPNDGSEARALLRAADVAMLEAKRCGGHTYRFGEDSAVRRLRDTDRLRLDFFAALGKGEMHVLFQSIVALNTGRCVGAEALVRWHHPLLGVLSPPAFLPAAEESGHILDFGEWVLTSACHTAVQWTGPGRVPPTVSVNVSSRQFIGSQLVRAVEAALTSTGLTPAALKLEFREDFLFARGSDGPTVLHALRRLGIGLVIDGFGTGHASLEELCDLPLSGVKLAPAFVTKVGRDARADALVQALVAMAQSLELDLVAVGIETAAQADALRRFGCLYGQGNHLGAPIAADEIRASMLAAVPRASGQTGLG